MSLSASSTSSQWTGGKLLRGEAGADAFRGTQSIAAPSSQGDLFVAIAARTTMRMLRGRSARERAAGAARRRPTESKRRYRPEHGFLVARRRHDPGARRLAAGHRRSLRRPAGGDHRQQRQDDHQGASAPCILAREGPCLKTRGNLNNNFGVPLTLLRREARTTALRGGRDGHEPSRRDRAAWPTSPSRRSA